MQAGGGRWSAEVLWQQIRRYASAGASVVFHPPLGSGALCSYTDLGAIGLDISCSAYADGVLVQVKPPAPVRKAQTNEAVALLRSGLAHLARVRH